MTQLTTLAARRIGALALVLALAGCIATPIQPGDTLTYTLPTTIKVDLGQELLRTGIRYERLGEDGAHLRIDGQDALKRKGDSVDWEGSPLAGVAVDLAMRVLWYNENAVHLAGTATVNVKDTNPRSGGATTTSAISFTGPVAYAVGKGDPIPGSTLRYDGNTEDGARLSGVDGYPYRKVGDSVVWEGVLRDQVSLRLELRVVQYDEEGLRLAGTASLWIGS
ncbi:MAG: hypothetical protein ACYC4R_17050 [Anaerolineae bacterium]